MACEATVVFLQEAAHSGNSGRQRVSHCHARTHTDTAQGLAAVDYLTPLLSPPRAWPLLSLRFLYKAHTTAASPRVRSGAAAAVSSQLCTVVGDGDRAVAVASRREREEVAAGGGRRRGVVRAGAASPAAGGGAVRDHGEVGGDAGGDRGRDRARRRAGGRPRPGVRRPARHAERRIPRRGRLGGEALPELPRQRAAAAAFGSGVVKDE